MTPFHAYQIAPARTLAHPDKRWMLRSLTRLRKGVLSQRLWGFALVAGIMLADPAFSKTPDPASIKEAMSYYDQWLAYQRAYLRIPGIQVAVRVGDNLVFTQSYGQADVEKRVPLRNDTLFRIGSQSKSFTAVLVLRLAEQGKLRLDDSAGQWLPWLSSSGSPLAQITVRQLLSQSAGITRDGRDSSFWDLDKPFPDRMQLREEILTPEASVIPANQHIKYSNIGFALLGLIIESVTHKDYNTYVKDEIVDSLGLMHTGPEYDPDRASEYATGYTSLLYADHRVPIDHVDTKAMSAAAGFYSTAEDLTRYYSTYFIGNSALLSDGSKLQMQRPVWHSEPGEDDPQDYGLGLRTYHVGDRKLVGHGGAIPGEVTISMTDPHDRIVVSVMTNALRGPADSCARAAYRLLGLAQKTREDETTPAVPAGVDLNRFTGRYIDLWEVLDVALLGGRLYLLRPEQADPIPSAVPLTAINGNTLRVDGGSGDSPPYGQPITFQFAGDGSVASMQMGETYLPAKKWRLPERVRLAR